MNQDLVGAKRQATDTRDASELDAWTQRLGELGIAIEERKVWDRGGISLYFRDPDQHLLELATPGVWSIY